MLAALLILAIGVTGLVRAARAALFSEGRLETRLLALWVAENRLGELRSARLPLPFGVSEETTRMAGRTWEVRIETQPTARADMERIEVRAAPQEDPGDAAQLSGYLGTY
jgi:general secretion pathway protein I